MKSLFSGTPAPVRVCIVLAVLITSTAGADCIAPGQWWDSRGEQIPTTDLYETLAEANVVLLGETHDRMEHHRWQLHTLAALHARRPDMVIGLEMLPRNAQPALDAWVQGEISEHSFLQQSEWTRSWGFDAQLYLPILHFARMNRIPVLALNLDRSLIARLREEGWEAVPAGERYEITPPAPATDGYRDYLGAVLANHPTGNEDGGDLDRFVAAQLIWDRAMAVGIAQAANEGHFVVGLMGSGHLEYAHGVPHQLEDLGITHARILLPLDVDAECTAPKPGVADALYAIAPGNLHELPRPLLLGVRIEDDPEGVRIQFVMEDSVAETSGLKVGDIIIRASGLDTRLPSDLQAVVRRQTPGNVMPLDVLRDGENIELLARFPPLQD